MGDLALKQLFDELVSHQLSYLSKWIEPLNAYSNPSINECLPLDYYLGYARAEAGIPRGSHADAHSSSGLRLINADQFALELYVPALIRAHGCRGGFGRTLLCGKLFKSSVIAPFGLGLAEMTLKEDELKQYVETFSRWMEDNTEVPIILFHSRCEVSLHRLLHRFSVRIPSNLYVVSIESQLPRRICSLSVPYPVSYELDDLDLYNKFLKTRMARISSKLRTGQLERSIHFAGKKRGETSFNSRHRQRNSCCDFADTSSLFLRSEVEVSKRRHLLTHKSNLSLSIARQSSLLSLEPPGDTPSRKGFYDSLVIGSIPIILEDSLWNFPFDSQINLGCVPLILSHNESVKLATGFTQGLKNYINKIPSLIDGHAERLLGLASSLIISDPRSPESANSRYWELLSKEILARIEVCL